MKVYTKVVMDWDGNILEEESYEYSGPVARCGGGGGSNTTTVQKADPWKGQQPYLTDIFQEAQNLYQTSQPTYYPGQTTANFNPAELASQSMALQAAGGQGAIGAQSAQANQFLLGDVLTADSNPYMQQYAAGAIRPVFDELTRRALPQIGSGAVAAGQYGGSRQGIAEGLAISEATQKAMDTTSRIYSDAYGQNLEALTKGLALAPQTQQSLLAPATTVGAVGGQQRAFEQALIDEAIQRHTFEQSIPWDTLAAYQGLVQGNFGGTGTSSVSGGGTSTAQNLVGAAGTGLATYGGMTAMGGVMATAAPWAAAGMALLSLF